MVDPVIKIFLTSFSTSTGGVGDLANLTLALALVLPASLIYKRRKTKKRAILGLVVGSLCMIALAPVLNYYILIPLFISFVGENFDIGLYIVAGALPITAIKAVAESVVVILLYKRLSGILHKQPEC